MIPVQFLPLRAAPGPWQMAADEVLLERASAGEASFRLYTWDPPTVSLGYFQKHEERLADAKLAAYPWVRRCTGGGAIIHDRDLTYAFALPESALGGRSPLEWHQRFHDGLAKVLQAWRITAAVKSGPRHPQEELAYNCFAVPQPGDVVLGAEKIVGGAQRLRRGALLQHGSIQLPAVIDRATELAQTLANELGWDLQPAQWSAAELERIDTLAEEKYGNAAWNCKR